MSLHQSPFDRLHADAWSNDFADVPTLNAAVSNALIASIDATRHAARAEALRSHAVLVLGPAGSGKTHLFARLRRKCGPKAAFVLLRPELAVDPTPRHVLAACVDALHQRVAGREERQLDYVVGSAVSLLRGGKREFPTVVLEELRHATPHKRDEWIFDAIERIDGLYPGSIEVTWLERFLRLPFGATMDRHAALTWLSGREPSEAQLTRLGIREPLGETSVVPALKTLAVLAAYSTPLVLVFDQLENLVDEDGTERRVRAHGNLVSELYDSVKGLVIVQLALDAEWQRRIYPALSESQKSRLAQSIEKLALPTPAERDELVAAWIERLPPSERKPRPWPFAADAWERWRTGLGVTPRMLMIACKEALEHGPDVAPPEKDAPGDTESLADRLEEIWNEQLDAARASVDAAHQAGHPLDPQHIASGIAAALSLVGDADVRLPPSTAKHALRLKTAASEDVDLFVVQSGHPKSVASALSHAAGAAKERRVVAVRQAAHAFPPTWKVVAQHARKMLDTGRVDWIELTRDEVVSLIAVHDLLTAARSQDLAGRDGRPLEEAVVRDWAITTLGVASWRALEAMLAPSATAETVAEAAETYEPTPTAGDAERILRRLRIASVDRILREARAARPGTTRPMILAELRELKTRVRWFGRSILSWREGKGA